MKCKYYPCHEFPDGRDYLNCELCYCPLYPCENKYGFGKWITGVDGKKVLDCSDCNIVHRDDIVSQIKIV